MNRPFIAVLLRRTSAAPLLAQAPPAGWKMRVDRSTSATDPDAAGAIKFVTMGTGFHATNPQAAVFWNPGQHRHRHLHAEGQLHAGEAERPHELLRPGLRRQRSRRAGQSYLYFLVAQDGTWLVKHRAGDATTQDVAPKTASDAVKKPDASGKSANALEVRVPPTRSTTS